MPVGSDQLKREKLELGLAIWQVLREIGQRCPGVLLEQLRPQNASSQLAQDLVSFLLLGLADPQELRALFFVASTWSGMLEASVSSPAGQEVLASLPTAQLLQRLLWSVARMDYNDAQSQKILSESASILRSLTNTQLLPPSFLQQASETLQQALVGALPGLRSDAAPRRLCEALSQNAALKDVRAALQQCAADWRRECGS